MKNDIRHSILKKRSNLCQDQILKLSHEICNNIINWTFYKEANTIMIYYSFRNEVITDKIIHHALNTGKQVVLPKSIKEGRRIIPYKISSLDQLERGNYGVMEPPTDDIAEKNEIDIVFVPGVAFDNYGFRVGYGAGYYDRFLKEYKGIKAGICFNLQIVENASPDEHDIPMEYLISEKGINKTGDL
jgi:5-formyltetrahydrofolate cyclo-ligase